MKMSKKSLSTVEKFSEKYFGADMSDTARCIANELAELKYSKTGDVDSCRLYAEQLPPESKADAMTAFSENEKVVSKYRKRVKGPEIGEDESIHAKEAFDELRRKTNKEFVLSLIAVILSNVFAIAVRNVFLFAALNLIFLTLFVKAALAKSAVRKYGKYTDNKFFLRSIQPVKGRR